jgi:hypothetical protein
MDEPGEEWEEYAEKYGSRKNKEVRVSHCE